MTDLTTTRARAWRLQRADGLTLGFTDHDADLGFDGTMFRAQGGMTARALSQATGLAVDNTEALGALTDAGLTERDILAGHWDGAGLTIFEVDWTDPAQRRILFRGTLGEITRQSGAFRAELRGLTEPLQQGRGRVFGGVCPAVLGDARCRADVTGPAFRLDTVITAVADGDLVLPPLPAHAPGWFTEGHVVAQSGPAQGLSAVIRADRAVQGARRLSLWAAPGLLPVAGDAVRLTAGCDKRFSTCRIKFDNALNFQGFPHLPGEDFLLLAPRPGASGGPRNV